MQRTRLTGPQQDPRTTAPASHRGGLASCQLQRHSSKTCTPTLPATHTAPLSSCCQEQDKHLQLRSKKSTLTEDAPGQAKSDPAHSQLPRSKATPAPLQLGSRAGMPHFLPTRGMAPHTFLQVGHTYTPPQQPVYNRLACTTSQPAAHCTRCPYHHDAVQADGAVVTTLPLTIAEQHATPKTTHCCLPSQCSPS